MIFNTKGYVTKREEKKKLDVTSLLATSSSKVWTMRGALGARQSQMDTHPSMVPLCDVQRFVCKHVVSNWCALRVSSS
uniref:Uncharacterized protein n=1 Tax=Kalanchoe fedtschenkoi TaxID=63787 RepID=A0A7N0VKD6_KALFE